MCYRCGQCNKVVKTGAMKRHITYRQLRPSIKPALVHEYGKEVWKQVEVPGRYEIASELPVCQGCADFLARIASGQVLRTVSRS